jgi:hypothetical protein
MRRGVVKVSYEEAVKECASYGGATLALIDSEEKNTFAMQACGCRSCWLGLQWSEDSSAWAWRNGEIANVNDTNGTYQNWAPGAPAGEIGHGGVMNALDQAATGKWVSLELDPSGHDYGGYVVALCEKPKSQVKLPLKPKCQSDELEFATGSCEPNCESAAVATQDVTEEDLDKTRPATFMDRALTFLSVAIVFVAIFSGFLLLFMAWDRFPRGKLFIGPGAKHRAEAYERRLSTQAIAKEQLEDEQNGIRRLSVDMQSQLDMGMLMPGARPSVAAQQATGVRQCSACTLLCEDPRSTACPACGTPLTDTTMTRMLGESMAIGRPVQVDAKGSVVNKI